MATTTVLFDRAKKYVLDGTIDLDTDTLKVALLSSAFNPNATASAYATSTAYAAGTIMVRGGVFYEAVIGGNSAGAALTFSTVVGSVTVDNTISWYCWGYAPPSPLLTFADVSASEITGTGYTAGGAALTGAAVTQTNRSAKFSANDVSWAAAVFTARYAVIYKVGTANAVVNPLLGYVLLDSTNADVAILTPTLFTLGWSASGIFTFT